MDGYVIVSVSDIMARYNQSGLEVDLYAGSDTRALFSANGGRENPINLWFATAPGTTYRISVKLSDTIFFDLVSYTLHASYTPIEDTFEPNQSETSATPISLGKTVHAYMSGGYTNSTTNLLSAWWDYCKFTLVAGSATFTLTDLPSDLRFEAYMYDDLGSNSQIRGYASNLTAGADITFTTDPDLPAGTYFLQIEPLDFFAEAFGPGTTPGDYLTHPYALTVTQ